MTFPPATRSAATGHRERAVGVAGSGKPAGRLVSPVSEWLFSMVKIYRFSAFFASQIGKPKAWSARCEKFLGSGGFKVSGEPEVVERVTQQSGSQI